MSTYNGIKINCNPAIFGGRPIVGGHRVAVHGIVVARQTGMSKEEIAEAYTLTPDEVTAALAYYEDHKATIDREIGEDDEEFARRAALDTSSVPKRMRELGRSAGRRQAR